MSVRQYESGQLWIMNGWQWHGPGHYQCSAVLNQLPTQRVWSPNDDFPLKLCFTYVPSLPFPFLTPCSLRDAWNWELCPLLLFGLHQHLYHLCEESPPDHWPVSTTTSGVTLLQTMGGTVTLCLHYWCSVPTHCQLMYDASRASDSWCEDDDHGYIYMLRSIYRAFNWTLKKTYMSCCIYLNWNVLHSLYI